MAEIASAFVSIAPSARGFGSSLSRQVGGETRAAGTSIGKTFGRMFVAGAGILAAAGVGKLLTGSIDEAREAQKVGAQTNAVLKSTGGAANVTAGQVGKLASALSAKIGVDDEAIQAGENMLLTFTRVRNEAGKGNDIFNQATRTVQNMAATFGGDATSNSKILGKALNDPVKGITALGRAGVQFTDKQKDQIKTLVESGNVMGAQKIILKELAKETKGSAEAQATAGDKARVALDNLKETIGTALLPVIDKLAGVFTNTVAPAITTFIGQLKSGEGAGGKVAAVFAAVGGVIATFVGQMRSGEGAGGAVVSVFTQVASVLGTVFSFISNNQAVVATFVGIIAGAVVVAKAFAAAQLLVNLALSANPIGLIVIAIAALVAGLVYAYKNSETFRNAVDTLGRTFKAVFSGIKKVVSTVLGFIKDHWRTIIVILGGPIGLAVALITKHWDKIKAGAQVVIGWVKDHWPAIKALITGPFETAKTVIGKVWTALRQGASRVKEVLTKVFNAISSAIQGAIDKAQTLIDKLRTLAGMDKGTGHGRAQPLGPENERRANGVAGGLVKGAFGGKGDLVAATLGLTKTSTENMGKQADKLSKKLKEKLSGIRDALASVRSDFASLVDPIASNFTQGLFDFDTAGAFTANLTTVKGTLTTLLANFKKLIGEGLKPGFLYQLFESGGPALINSLAGLDKASALGAGSLFGDVMSLSDQLGAAVAASTDKGAALENQTVRLERKLDKLIKHVDQSADRTGDRVNGAAARGHGRGR